MEYLSKVGSNKSQVVSTALRTIESEAQAAELESKRAWLSKLTDREVKTIFGGLWEAFDKAKKSSGWLTALFDGSAWFHATVAKREFRRVEKAWLNVDRSNLNDEAVVFMYDILTQVLPDAAGVYRRHANEYDRHVAIYGVYSSDQFSLNRQLPVEQTLRFKLNRLFVELEEIQHAQWSAGYAASVVKPVQRPVLLVPEVSGKDSGLVDAVGVLGELWLAARGLRLSDTDRFFVDEVAGRYFPDAWRMFQGFEGGDERMWGEARAVFLEQVGLMSRKLRQMGAVQANQASLQELEAHSVFLREVTA